MTPQVIPVDFNDAQAQRGGGKSPNVISLPLQQPVPTVTTSLVVCLLFSFGLELKVSLVRYLHTRFVLSLSLSLLRDDM